MKNAAQAAAPAPQVAAGSNDDPRQGNFTVNDRRHSANPSGDDEPAGGTKKPSFVAELEQKLADKETRLQATLAQYKEALDEFEATKIRLRRDIAKEIEAGKKAMLCDLLDVVDNLERAIDSSDQGASALHKGVCMVRDQFLAKLESLGVRKLDLLHKPFDADTCEAISTVPVTDAAQDGAVVGVVRVAYKMGDQTLRHGMVAVGALQAKADQ